MTVGPLYVERDKVPGASLAHHLILRTDTGPLKIAALTTAEATRVEAQIAGSSLRIVDAAGNLPTWPDLTELRRNVERFREATTTADMELARHDVITSALSLADVSPSPEPAEPVPADDFHYADHGVAGGLLHRASACAPDDKMASVPAWALRVLVNRAKYGNESWVGNGAIAEGQAALAALGEQTR